MTAQFLSQDWFDAANTALSADDGFQAAASGTELSLQFKVTDAPEGEAEYMLVLDGETGTLSPGAHDDPDATITNNYDTAVAVSKGDLNVQTAFITGKVKVDGNMAKIMMNVGALNSFAAALSHLDASY
jgi:putative sterol carrier protein